jgi:hypothetical protein
MNEKEPGACLTQNVEKTRQDQNQPLREEEGCDESVWEVQIARQDGLKQKLEALHERQQFRNRVFKEGRQLAFPTIDRTSHMLIHKTLPNADGIPRE